MRYLLIAFAACAAAGGASAQSSVTMYGVLDLAYTRTSSSSMDARPSVLPNAYGIPTYANQGRFKTSRTELLSSGDSVSRMGFRGTEDLGGGLAAGFWLEAPISVDDGQLGISTFSFRSTVSLSGGFGEVRLGRDYTAQFFNDYAFSAFDVGGIGYSLVLKANYPGLYTYGRRVPGESSPILDNNYLFTSNTITYVLPPNLGGFYGQLQYGLPENVKVEPGSARPAGASSRTGRYLGGRFGYANGPLDVAMAFAKSTVGDDYFAGLTTNANTLSLGATYDFGSAKLFSYVSRTKKVSNHDGNFVVRPVDPPDIGVRGYLFGVTVPVGPGVIRASYGHVKHDDGVPDSFGVADPRASQWALGYMHNLSKRTALYATVSRISNKNGAAYKLSALSDPTPYGNPQGFTPTSSTGYEFGVRHSF